MAVSSASATVERPVVVIVAPLFLEFEPPLDQEAHSGANTGSTPPAVPRVAVLMILRYPVTDKMKINSETFSSPPNVQSIVKEHYARTGLGGQTVYDLEGLPSARM